MKDLIIQHCLGHDSFHDMARLTVNRHMAYARAFDFDYWNLNGDIRPEMYPGAWAKIWLMKWALEAGHPFIAWIDSDAVIMDFGTDLRDALKDQPFDIGLCKHDAPWFKEPQWNIPAHMNVGVMYVRNTERSKKFIDDWLASYPGDQRWMEQGAFNKLAEGNGAVGIIDDKWNATVNVNMVDKPVVKGYHGVNPIIQRFNMMKADCIEDHINYRV